MDNKLYKTLKSRGLIYQTSNDAGTEEALTKPITVYQGFDPSADSFHVGNLVGLMVLHRFQQAGHRVICLLGGGTGRIGDPTDKSATRVMLTPEIVKNNVIALQKQVEKIGLLSFSGENPAIMVNNDEWLVDFKFLEDFMANIAVHFSVNDMVKMRTFATRLEEEKPLSLFEFIYPVMQGWDFMHLYKKYKCTLQIGGQDQWVNILSGVELVRKSLGKEVFAATIPLLTTSDGRKMGKTEQGAVWLDPVKTSPYDFYQYFVKTPDDVLDTTFKMLTFLEPTEISEILKNPKEAQKRLAYEITKIVHGEEAAIKASSLESKPIYKITHEDLTVAEALFDSGVLPSKSEVRRRIEQGGVKIGDHKVTSTDTMLREFKNKLPDLSIEYGKGKLLGIVDPDNIL